jgi:hypothetical protein
MSTLWRVSASDERGDVDDDAYLTLPDMIQAIGITALVVVLDQQ